jgi:hypothetical protein
MRKIVITQSKKDIRNGNLKKWEPKKMGTYKNGNLKKWEPKKWEPIKMGS